jgi:hypothetical protein
MKMTMATIKNTAATMTRRNMESNFRCMKYINTNDDFTVANNKAINTPKAPRSTETAPTESAVNTNNSPNIMPYVLYGTM